MSSSIDWGKIIGGMLAAGLIAFQVGMDSKLDTHAETNQRNVDRLEDTTMHKSTIEMHLSSLEAQIDKDVGIVDGRLMELERQMNSMYQGLDTSAVQ